MLDSGLRLNEVVTLRRDKIHIAEGYAIVNGKGNKERFVPLGLNSKKLFFGIVLSFLTGISRHLYS